MNLKKLLGKVVSYAKANPEKVLMVATLVAPGVVAKVAPKVAKAVAAVKVAKSL